MRIQDGPLFEAAFSGDAARVLARIKCGADVNYPDEEGQSPILIALKACHFDVVEVLIRCGANVHPSCPPRTRAATAPALSPLLVAVRSEDLRAVRALVRAGASPKTPEEEDFIEDDVVRVDIRARAARRS
ncbi:ankyrin repeat-containing domain protein [Pelagophyceae sp. CCMP2097]|nr:ankyrin repeat-containing domain protein [Pelagophyceae sp. CCMP2097]